jgi:hypothetical protein
LSGEFLKDHKGEILNLVRNEETRAKGGESDENQWKTS